MSGIFTSHCIKAKREYFTKSKIPLTHRNLSKSYYLGETLYSAWRYHLAMHNLQVEDVVFRKVIYDAIYDALENSQGKVHYKDFFTEYEKFNSYFEENFSHLKEKIADWEDYRKSSNYEIFLENLKYIKRFDQRLQASVDNALAYLYSKYQKKLDVAETIFELERSLKLDLIEKAWSKKWLWIAFTLLFFDANNLYAETLGNNKITIRDLDVETLEAIKIYTTAWYERKDLQVSEKTKWLMKIYENIIVPISGEMGSVALAEAVRRGTVISLIHIARALTIFAAFHPALRGLKWGSELVASLVQLLNGSVIAWLGWQIAVEWSLDAFIQRFMQEAAKFIYSFIKGTNAWDVTQGKGTTFFDFESVLKLLIKQYTKGLDQREWNIIQVYLANCHPKAREILLRVQRKLELASKMHSYRMKKYEEIKTDWENFLNNAQSYAYTGEEKEYKAMYENFLETAIDTFLANRYTFDFYIFSLDIDFEKNRALEYLLRGNIAERFAYFLSMLKKIKDGYIPPYWAKAEGKELYSCYIGGTCRLWESWSESYTFHEYLGQKRLVSSLFAYLLEFIYVDRPRCCPFSFNKRIEYKLEIKYPWVQKKGICSEINKLVGLDKIDITRIDKEIQRLPDAVYIASSGEGEIRLGEKRRYQVGNFDILDLKVQNDAVSVIAKSEVIRRHYTGYSSSSLQHKLLENCEITRKASIDFQIRENYNTIFQEKREIDDYENVVVSYVAQDKYLMSYYRALNGKTYSKNIEIFTNADKTSLLSISKRSKIVLL